MANVVTCRHRGFVTSGSTDAVKTTGVAKATIYNYHLGLENKCVQKLCEMLNMFVIHFILIKTCECYLHCGHHWDVVPRVDACESSIEIVTPYWASNSAGRIRAIVNTANLQQAIQQEVCQSLQTQKCKGECSCEQRYKWHRLLAFDPDDDCKGLFMDWFLFASCCLCRCSTIK
ncbi:Spaetzle [Cordylochernes scorpioides]|uniref:Spaetzle n=1 Tax=Cordylochernes scorpioides TaxID=51811 RepID=A0ABY6KTK6_9ARAC|nr:Spaetzle [Cordylochernes scorpioides]